MWHWLEKDTDPLAREITVYTFYCEGTQPNTATVDHALIVKAMDTAVTRTTSLTSAQLLQNLAVAGHGCAKDPRFTSAPRRVTQGDLEGIEFDFQCVGGHSGKLGISGTYALFMDAHGDRHLFIVTSDTENFTAKKGEYQTFFDSIAVKK